MHIIKSFSRVSLVVFALLLLASCNSRSSNSASSKIPNSEVKPTKRISTRTCNLAPGQSVRDMDLSLIDCSNKNLKDVTFANVILNQGNFSGANMTGVQFTNVEAKEANFSNSNLRGSKAINSDNSDFTRANFDGADLTMFTFGNDNILDEASFIGATMRAFEAVFGSARSVDFTNANLAKARFQDEILDSSIFDNAVLSGAVFSDNLMSGVSFRGAIGLDLSDLALRDSVVCGATDPSGQSLEVNC